MSTPDTMDTIDEAEQAWREYKNSSFGFVVFVSVTSLSRGKS